MTQPDPAERRIREVAAVDNTAHADDIRELLAEYDHRGTALIARDVALRLAAEENERLHTALTQAEHHTAELAAVIRDQLDDRDRIAAALTELRAASRGLAFFDQIKRARWNAAYQQATQVLGVEGET